MIGEEEVECHDDTEEYEETVMVDMVREECDTVMVSQCDTEYTQECDQARCQPVTQDDEECPTVMIEAGILHERIQHPAHNQTSRSESAIGNDDICKDNTSCSVVYQDRRKTKSNGFAVK